MTLNTEIYVLDPVDIGGLFAEGQRLLALYDDRPNPPAQKSYSEMRGAGTWITANEIGQGLPAIWEVEYLPGGMFRTPEDAASHELNEYCNHPDNPTWYEDDKPLCAKTEHDVPCYAECSFDTTYSYRDAQGRNCGDLHALLVAGIGGWLTRQGIRWSWRNEYTGEVHDDLESLIGLVSGGFEASAWFRTMVLPAISAAVESEGGVLEL